MLIRIRMDLAFNIVNQSQAEQLKDAIVPFVIHAVNINEGMSDEEIGYISIESCGHAENPPQPCKIIARWEVGRGRVT